MKDYISGRTLPNWKAHLTKGILLAIIGILAIVFALTFPPHLLPFAGFGYSLMGIWIPLVMMYRSRSQPADN